jgi:pyruvate oxidase
MRTVATYVVEQLQAWGVDTLFGVPGSDVLTLLEAIRGAGGIRFYGCRHEEAAGLMASAYAQLTGHPGVVLSHSGPGAARLLNALYHAAADRLPVVALTGQVALGQMGTRAPQTAPLERMMGPATRFSATVVDPDSVGELLAEAWLIAEAERRPVHLAIPVDIQGRASRARLYARSAPADDPAPDQGAVEAAALLLSRARAPVILAGRGARGGRQEILELAERLQAPIVTSLLGKGVVPDRHPLVMGVLGEAGTPAAILAARRADVLLTVGSSWWPRRGTGFPPPPDAVVQIDPDPTTVGATAPVGIALTGSAEGLLPALVARVRPHRPRKYLERLMAAKQAWWGAAYVDEETAWHPRTVLDALGQAVPEDTVICVDTGAHTLWAGSFYTARQETWLLSGRWRTLGYALPAAAAAKAARPESFVVALQGDGGGATLLGELGTAARYRLPLVALTLNNQSWGLEAHTARRRGQDAGSMALAYPDFPAVAAASGWVGQRVLPGQDLAAIIGDALQQDVPVLLDLPVRNLAPPLLEPARRPVARR